MEQIGRVRAPPETVPSEQRESADAAQELQSVQHGRHLHGEPVHVGSGSLRLHGPRRSLVALVRPRHPPDVGVDARRRPGRVPTPVRRRARIPLQIRQPAGQALKVLPQLRRQHLTERRQRRQRPHARSRLHLQRTRFLQQQYALAPFHTLDLHIRSKVGPS